MSTLNSTHLYLSRSSTRVHAPPGGNSQISFGGYTATPSPVIEEKPIVEEAPIVVEETVEKVVVAEDEKTLPETTVSTEAPGETFSGLVYSNETMSEKMIEDLKAKGIMMTKMLNVDGSLVYKMSVMSCSDTAPTKEIVEPVVEPEVVVENSAVKEKEMSPKKVYRGGAGPSSVIFG